MPQASPGKTITDSAQILPGIIINSDINASAAIDYSKLNLALGIVNADVNASAAIVDTKLATITTAGKVSGAALTLLANTPAGAGVIPVANLPQMGEYTYLEKLTFTAEAATKTSTTFSARDEIMLIIRLHNTVAANAPDPILTLNGITASAYEENMKTATAFADVATRANWLLYQHASGNVSYFYGRFYISGRHNAGVKTIAAAEEVLSENPGGLLLKSGYLTGNSADVTSLAVTTANTATGTVEIWVKSNN